MKEVGPVQKTKKRLSALILATCLLAALVCGGVAAWAVGGWPEGDSNENTLTVTAAHEDAYVADLVSANLVVDVYQVAKASPDEGSVTYDYELTGPFAELSLGDESSWNIDVWSKFAADAAKLVTADMEPMQVAADGATPLELPGDGLYLVLPHAEGVSPDYGADVLASLVVRGAVRDDGSQYDYAFAPSIVAAPNAADESGAATTAGVWTRDVRIVLKPTKKPCYGSLVINKTVLNSGDYAVRPTSFAFTIEGTQPDGKKYENVASIYYNGGTPEPAVLKHIQAGTVVTVTEVALNEAAWHPVGDTVATATIVADTQTELGGAKVSFTNEYVPTQGFAIQNTFELQSTDEGEGDWDWEWIQVTPDGVRTDPPTE